MLNPSSFIRLLAIPACVVWGLKEFFALQRAHWTYRKPSTHI